LCGNGDKGLSQIVLRAVSFASIYPLPVKAIPAGFERVEIDGRFRANWLVCLVENDHVPGSLRLEYGNVILAASFGADDGIAMPVVVTNQPHAGQRNTTYICDTPDDIAWRSGTSGARLR
jgi:hypothetical protein